MTPEQIKQLAEAQRDNPELRLLQDYDFERIDVLWVGDKDMAIRAYDEGLPRGIVGRPCSDSNPRAIIVTDAGREWLRINGGEWIKAGGKACAVEVRYVAAEDRTEMRCTHIDERIRGHKCEHRQFSATNEWYVGSEFEPQILGHHQSVWLSGQDQNEDDNIASCIGNHVAAILTAVNEANAAWEKAMKEKA